MKKLFAILVVIILSYSISYGQITVRGKVTDSKGETLIGVSVALKSNRTIGAITDFDGNYTIKIPDTASKVLVISYIGYVTSEESFQGVNGEVVVKNFVMVSSTQDLKSVDINAKAVKTKDYYVENVKKNSATTIDYVSSESMKKTGDNNVVSAIARVSGVSTNGGFITVRGIGDRYVKTAVNGSRIPTLDPFTNNIKLDLFPASLVDNIIITKTASPDLPGDWAGAYISIETKDYPDRLEVNAETTVGYNQQSTFKEVITSQRSNTDWLGYDNSLRDHDHSSFVANINAPSQYQQFVALGLGDYFNSLGVNEQNWGDGTTRGDTYFKLGLVQLGLLAPALINDEAAFQAARSEYNNGEYRSEAFKIINSNVPASGQSFPVNWNVSTRKAPLNFSQSFSVGNQFDLRGHPLGFIAGFRYGSSTLYDDHSTANRASVVGDGNGSYINSVSNRLVQQNSIESNGWSALFNLAYKLNNNNTLSFLFMPNFNGVNKVRKSLDRQDAYTVATLSQFYEQRKQLVYQFKSEHFVPILKLKLETNASYTRGESSAPDFKNLQYWINDDGTYQIGGTIGDGIHRYYRYLSDNLLDTRISGEFPIGDKPGLSRKVKLGGSYQRIDKKSDQYDYTVEFGQNLVPLFNEDIDDYLNIDKFGITSSIDVNGIPYSAIQAYYSDASTFADHNFGYSNIAAGYFLIDYTIIPKLRATGGLRIEKAYVFTDVNAFDSLGLPENDPRRTYNAAYPIANPGKLDDVDYLPSINLIYKINANEQFPVNLRFNYSQSIARPSIRELSDVLAYDYELRSPVFGNSKLKTVHIDNYDMRLEYYFKSNDNVSVSLFYKDFRDHIELLNSGGYTWQNVDKSNVKGIELEGRKIITKQLEFRANVSFVKSETNFVRQRLEIKDGIKVYIPLDTVSRAMFGQAPYALNAILSYSADSLGLVITAGYNVQGPRLVIASDLKEIPDVYELPRNLLDLKITKTIGKHFKVSFTVKDILNEPIRRSYKYSEGYDVLDYDKFTYGTNYVLGVAYKL